jgi:hypothetical protein
MSYRVWACLITAVVCLVLALTFPVRSDRFWVDPVSGSTKSQTMLFFVSSPYRVRQSELERWIIAHEGFHDSDWQFVNETHRMISGRWAGCGVGRAPKILSLLPVDVGLARLVHNATDEEIAEFVRVMKHGTPDEQTQTLEEAGAIIILGGESDRSRSD